MKPVITSFYTEGTGYKQEADRLRKSLEALDDVEWFIDSVPNLGSWEKNASYKANFMRDMLDKFQRPVVWVDADAVVHSYPALFDEIEADIAAHYLTWNEFGRVMEGGLRSGTLYLEPTEATNKLIKQWLENNQLKPNVSFPQSNLHDAVEQTPELRVYKLPREYCCIVGWAEHYHITAVVEHLQASRKFRGRV